MRVEVKLEKKEENEELGEKAKISFWYKELGEEVEKDEDLVEILTDKAALTVTSPAHGKLIEIIAEEGDEVSFGDVLGIIEAESAD